MQVTGYMAMEIFSLEFFRRINACNQATGVTCNIDDEQFCHSKFIWMGVRHKGGAGNKTLMPVRHLSYGTHIKE